jgi:hypothetical protein
LSTTSAVEAVTPAKRDEVHGRAFARGAENKHDQTGRTTLSPLTLHAHLPAVAVADRQTHVWSPVDIICSRTNDIGLSMLEARPCLAYQKASGCGGRTAARCSHGHTAASQVPPPPSFVAPAAHCALLGGWYRHSTLPSAFGCPGCVCAIRMDCGAVFRPRHIGATTIYVGHTFYSPVPRTLAPTADSPPT